MRVALGSDHAGVRLKAQIAQALADRHISYHDFGPSTDAPVDYPDYALPVAKGVASGRFERGILICGTGVGMAIAANKFAGVRAAAIHDVGGARLCRQHNDANVLTVGARVVSVEEAVAIIESFLATPFEGGRHQRRVDKIAALECTAPAAADTDSAAV